MIGQRINNYEITALLGQGGMGSVYLAHHPVLGRRAAVKLLRPEYAVDENLVGRFINEARASSAIHHPGIIEVFDVGTLPGGQPYLMMELLEGVTLAGEIARLGHLRAPDAIDIALQSAAALAAAHTHGIVHRDLKPDNLFLVADPTRRSGHRVKVLDFGIAKLHRRWTGQAVRTHTGTLMGTPPYMSPEQCRGISSDIDQRTDVYALGIILYEMLVGAPPFMSKGFGDVLMMHMTEPPRPPREVDAAIPRALESAVLRALEKDPGRRFADMDELASALAASGSRPTARDDRRHAEEDARALASTPAPRAAGRSPAAPTDPGTTLSSSVGQLVAVGPPVVQSTMRIGHRRQQVGAAVGASLAAAAAIAFFMSDRAPSRPADRVVEPAATVGAPAPEPAATVPPIQAPPAAAAPEPATLPTTPEPIAPTAPLAPPPPPPAVRAATFPTRSGKGPRRPREAISKRAFLPVSDPVAPPASSPLPAPGPAPTLASPPPPAIAIPPRSRADAGVPPARPHVNTEKW